MTVPFFHLKIHCHFLTSNSQVVFRFVQLNQKYLLWLPFQECQSHLCFVFDCPCTHLLPTHDMNFLKIPGQLSCKNLFLDGSDCFLMVPLHCSFILCISCKLEVRGLRGASLFRLDSWADLNMGSCVLCLASCRVLSACSSVVSPLG